MALPQPHRLSRWGFDAPPAVVPRMQMLCFLLIFSLTVSPPGLLGGPVTGLQKDENEELFPCSDRRPPVRNSYINAENKHINSSFASRNRQLLT